METKAPYLSKKIEFPDQASEKQTILQEGEMLLKILQEEFDHKDLSKAEKLEITRIRKQLKELIKNIEKDQQLPSNYQEILSAGREKLQIDSIEELKEKYAEDPEKLKAIDALQAALDLAGLEQTMGIFADLSNTLIYSFRSAKAALSGKNKVAKQHLLDAGISAIAILPFADVIKILRLRKVPKLAKATIKGARATKNYAKKERIKRSHNTFDKMAA